MFREARRFTAALEDRFLYARAQPQRFVPGKPFIPSLGFTQRCFCFGRDETRTEKGKMSRTRSIVTGAGGDTF